MNAKERIKKNNKVHTRWFRWRFHLTGVLILIPIALTPYYLELTSLFSGSAGLGQHVVGTKTVGPWRITLAEQREVAPRLDGAAGYMKSFNAALCQQCANEVKAVYMRLGKPRSLRTAGVIGFGTPYAMSFTVPVPENTPLDADIWLTLEGWDGAIHQTQWRLADASPSTIEFLKQR